MKHVSCLYAIDMWKFPVVIAPTLGWQQINLDESGQPSAPIQQKGRKFVLLFWIITRRWMPLIFDLVSPEELGIVSITHRYFAIIFSSLAKVQQLNQQTHARSMASIIGEIILSIFSRMSQLLLTEIHFLQKKQKNPIFAGLLD